MQEGTPITFKMHRYSRRSKLPMSSGSEGHLGVFVSSFKQTIKGKYTWRPDRIEEKARVYSPHSKQVHTCELNTMSTLDGKRFNPESIISLHWEALMKVMPPDLVVNYNFVADRLEELLFRSRSTHLVNILPKDWPKNEEFKKVVDSWTLQPCWISTRTSRNDNVVGYEDCIVSANHDSASILRRSKPTWEKDGWLYYDPALKEQYWQAEARNLLKRMMLSYETAKRKGFKKEETTNE